MCEKQWGVEKRAEQGAINNKNGDKLDFGWLHDRNEAPPKVGLKIIKGKKNTWYLKMDLGIQIQFLDFPAVWPQANDPTFQKVAQFL